MRLEDPRRETVAWGLARGKTQAEAGRDAGVDRSSVKRWIKEEPLLRRVDELKILMQNEAMDEGQEEAKRGLARLVPMAEAVVEASLKGEPYNGKAITAQQHQNALRTIELAHKLEPRATGGSSAPSIGDLIREADARRARTD